MSTVICQSLRELKLVSLEQHTCTTAHTERRKVSSYLWEMSDSIWTGLKERSIQPPFDYLAGSAQSLHHLSCPFWLGIFFNRPPWHIHSLALTVTDGLMMKTGAMTVVHIYSLLSSDKALSTIGSHRLPEPRALHLVGLPLTSHTAGGLLDPLSPLPEHQIFAHHNPSTRDGAAETTGTVLCLYVGGNWSPGRSDGLLRTPTPAHGAIAQVAFHYLPQSSSLRVGHEDRAQGLHEELLMEAEWIAETNFPYSSVWDLTSHPLQGLLPSLGCTEPLEHSPGCSGTLLLLTHLGHLSWA